MYTLRTVQRAVAAAAELVVIYFLYVSNLS